MTRTDFIRGYAQRSGLSDKWARLGFVEIGDRNVMIALPCACEDSCEGWAMVGAEGVSSHLELYAPEPIRSAFRAALAGESPTSP